MNVEFSRRALTDLREISAYYEAQANTRVAAAIASRIEATVARITRLPEGARRVAERPSVRAVRLIRYPFKVYYTVAEGGVVILHIRHTARREWSGKL